MSDNNNEVVDTSGEQLDFDDLDNFSSSFFGQNKDAQEEPAKPSDDSEEIEDTSGDVITDVDDDGIDDQDDTDDHDDQEEADKPEPEGKKPSRSQQRITELNTKYREAERREQALLARLEALENGSKKTDEPLQTKSSVDATPAPTDQNEDVTDKYPLGEFDPNFIRDLTKHTIAEAQKEAAAERSKADNEARQRQEAEVLQSQWQEKQGPVKERYPDYGEKVASLESVFADVDPDYGEYLAQTVMAMDKGPDVLYYLSNNPEEARAIVKQGGVKAVISLGRLESRFMEEEKPQPKPKVSSAPVPPPQNKGSAGGRRSVAPDTDDLDAFANEFFKRKK